MKKDLPLNLPFLSLAAESVSLIISLAHFLDSF